MNQQPADGAVTGQEDQQAAQQMYEVFSYLAQNPQQYAQVRQFMIDGDQLDPEDLPEQMSPDQIAMAAEQFGSVAQTGQMSQPQQQGISGQFAGPAQMPQPGVADELAKYGRNGDTMMAHINPQEAQMLKMMGGAGTINPTTGLPEYFSLKKFIKRVTKPVVGAVVGAVTGFFTAGPVGAVVGGVTGAAAGEQSYQASKATAQASNAAAAEQGLMQQAENNRVAEARQQAALAQQQYEEEVRRIEAEAARVRAAEASRQQNITLGQGEISSAFGQFNDDFYNNRMNSYTAYATPQLEKQYEDQMRSLTASLARSGNLNSSVRGELMSRLQEEYDKGKLTIADQARGFVDQARSSTEAARARLMESNAMLADPGIVRTSAAAEAARLSINPQYSNLGSMLSSLSADVGSGGAKTASQTAGGVYQFNTGLSGSAGRLVA
jgi:hypothetical protein